LVTFPYNNETITQLSKVCPFVGLVRVNNGTADVAWKSFIMALYSLAQDRSGMQKGIMAVHDEELAIIIGSILRVVFKKRTHKDHVSIYSAPVRNKTILVVQARLHESLSLDQHDKLKTEMQAMLAAQRVALQHEFELHKLDQEKRHQCHIATLIAQSKQELMTQPTQHKLVGGGRSFKGKCDDRTTVMPWNIVGSSVLPRRKRGPLGLPFVLAEVMYSALIKCC